MRPYTHSIFLFYTDSCYQPLIYLLITACTQKLIKRGPSPHNMNLLQPKLHVLVELLQCQSTLICYCS